MTLSNIPPELQIQIFSYLPISDQLNVANVCTRWRNLLLKTKSLIRTRYFNPSLYAPRNPPENMHRLLSYDRNIDRFDCIVRSGRVQEYLVLNPKSRNFRNITASPFLDEPLFSPFIREDEAFKRYVANFGVEVEFKSGNIALRRIGPGVDKFGAYGVDMTIRQMVDVVVQSSSGDIGLLTQDKEDVKTRIGFVLKRQWFLAIVFEIIPRSIA
ncbi:hypothetical protein AA313_de0202686 [Arthrobotrys entomopaga]|nr:hypothetical protein AA313_de0202686 [Arthrobotrys entomopaga]